MVDLRNAFQAAIGSAGSVRSATLQYLTRDQGQHIKFTLVKADGSASTAEADVPNGVDLIPAVKQMAADWLAANT